jgi:hypothetical protein
MVKRAVLSLCLLLTTTACNNDSTGPGREGLGAGVHLLGQHMIVARTGDVAAPVLLLGRDGSKTLLHGSVAGQDLTVTGATLTLPGGGSAAFFMDEEDRVEQAVFGNTIVLYSGHTETTVDIAVIVPGHGTQIHMGVRLSENAAGASGALLHSHSGAPGVAYAMTNWSLDMGTFTLTNRDLELLSASMSASSCIVSLLSTPTGVGIPLAAAACTIAVDALSAYVAGPTATSEVTGMVGDIMSAVECPTGNLGACIQTATTVVKSAVPVVQNLIDENQDAITEARGQLVGGPVGTWRLVLINGNPLPADFDRTQLTGGTLVMRADGTFTHTYTSPGDSETVTGTYTALAFGYRWVDEDGEEGTFSIGPNGMSFHWDGYVLAYRKN